eukprot:Rmarinus@m.16219
MASSVDPLASPHKSIVDDSWLRSPLSPRNEVVYFKSKKTPMKNESPKKAGTPQKRQLSFDGSENVSPCKSPLLNKSNELSSTLSSGCHGGSTEENNLTFTYAGMKNDVYVADNNVDFTEEPEQQQCRPSSVSSRDGEETMDALEETMDNQNPTLENVSPSKEDDVVVATREQLVEIERLQILVEQLTKEKTDMSVLLEKSKASSTFTEEEKMGYKKKETDLKVKVRKLTGENTKLIKQRDELLQEIDDVNESLNAKLEELKAERDEISLEYSSYKDNTAKATEEAALLKERVSDLESSLKQEQDLRRRDLETIRHLEAELITLRGTPVLTSASATAQGSVISAENSSEASVGAAGRVGLRRGLEGEKDFERRVRSRTTSSSSHTSPFALWPEETDDTEKDTIGSRHRTASFDTSPPVASNISAPKGMESVGMSKVFNHVCEVEETTVLSPEDATMGDDPVSSQSSTTTEVGLSSEQLVSGRIEPGTAENQCSQARPRDDKLGRDMQRLRQEITDRHGTATPVVWRRVFHAKSSSASICRREFVRAASTLLDGMIRCGSSGECAGAIFDHIAEGGSTITLSNFEEKFFKQN